MITTIPELEAHTLVQGQYTLHYVAAGNPAHDLIVFLHPAFGDHGCFSDQIAFFAEQYRVVVIDMIGHGKSQVYGKHGSIADMRLLVPAIIVQEGHSRAHLVGVSLGALIAQDVAVHSPDLVTSLTVVGGYPIGGASKAVQRAQGGALIAMLFLMLVSMPRLRRYVAATSTRHAHAREQFYRSAQAFTRRSFRVLSGMNQVMQPAYQPQRRPLLIVIGEYERPVLHEAASMWRDQEPLAHVRRIDDAGHCANMDNPAAFNALLLAWVRGNLC
jgi:pimeloyl-ACP methyl ester carboxylesterase